jgi:hypothetical protein
LENTAAGATTEQRESSPASLRRPVRDDRIFPVTRWVGAVIPPFLVLAFILLFFFPDNTAEHFAWTITPRMSPLLMGAGYISGSYFFIRLIMGGRWHWFSLGFPPITAFTVFMALATLLHWDKFDHNHVSFYAWLALYIVTPFLVPALWLLNRRTDPGTPDRDDVILPQWVRLVAGIVGGIMVSIALFMFIFPDAAISIWPWKLTPLTSRVQGGWFALTGVVGLMYATDRRWSAWRIVLETQIIGIALILIGILRAWSDFDQSRASTWLFVGGLSLLLLSLLALYIIAQQRQGKEAHEVQPGP